MPTKIPIFGNYIIFSDQSGQVSRSLGNLGVKIPFGFVTGRALEAAPDFRHESTRETSPR